MSLENKFIPLYFEEEDEDIWNAFQLIQPEERIHFIKLAIRKMLNIQNDFSPNAMEKQNRSELTLENLFHDDLALKELNTPSSTPWSYLLNEVIGNEEDEDVVTAICRAATHQDMSNKVSLREGEMQGKEVCEENINGDNLQEIIHTDYSLEDLFVFEEKQSSLDSHPSSLVGLKHLLIQVIGEEEDQDVIRTIQLNHQSNV